MSKHHANHCILEITGPPGAGKSTFIENNFQDRTTICGYHPKSYNLLQCVVASITGIIKVIFLNKISSKQLFWLLKQTWYYKERMYYRLNALRNCLLKFSNTYDEDSYTVIDEGISHIPFVLHLDENRIQEFVKIFKEFFLSRRIYYMNSPSEDKIYQRLLKRGHQQADTKNELAEIVKINLRVHEDYKRILMSEDIAVMFKDSACKRSNKTF